MLIILLNAIVVFLYFLGCELLVLSSMGPCLADFRCLSNWFLVLDDQNYIFVLNLFFGGGGEVQNQGGYLFSEIIYLTVLTINTQRTVFYDSMSTFQFRWK